MVQPSAHDIEGNRPFPNPYSTIAGPPVPGLYHPINILKRMIYSGISLFGLYHLNAYQAVLHSPHIRHEWFKIGLAATVGTQ